MFWHTLARARRERARRRREDRRVERDVAIWARRAQLDRRATRSATEPVDALVIRHLRGR